nr:MAG TPA: hypothetical protein [Caudoviricetes sp.]
MSRGDMLKKPCTDHLGNSYDSIAYMQHLRMKRCKDGNCLKAI